MISAFYASKDITYHMLSFHHLDVLRILRVVDMCAERDVVHGDLARDGMAFERNDFFGFKDDVLSTGEMEMS